MDLDVLRARLAATPVTRPTGRVVAVTGLSIRFAMPGVRVGDVVHVKRRARRRGKPPQARSVEANMLAAWLLSLALGAHGPIAQSTGIVRTLPPVALKTLAGCWSIKAGATRWLFRPNGTAGLEVVVEDDSWPGTPSVGMPSPVMSDSNGNYAFATRGRIHSLLVVFQIDGAQLKASYYTRHNTRQHFYRTGSTAVLGRCRR